MNDGDLEGSDDNEQEDNLEEDAESGMDPALPRCSEVVKSCDIGSTMSSDSSSFSKALQINPSFSHPRFLSH